MRPGKEGFDTERSRGVGGKTMLWNAVALRFSQRDFKGRTYDGAGEDWPVAYQDIAPVLRPDRARGRRLRQPRRSGGSARRSLPSTGSTQVQRRDPETCRRLARRPDRARAQGHAHGADEGTPGVPFLRQLHGGLRRRREVQLGGRAHRRPPSRAGRVTVFHDSVAREVLISDENRAIGVRYLHRVHQREGDVRGRAVVVACACVQSVALLMMSRSARYPTGLANSSGQLGRHFIPHFTGGIECVLNDLRGKTSANDEGFLDHAYLPSFVHQDKARGYARSFGAQFNYQNHRFAGWAKAMPGFGKAYKASVKAAYPAILDFTPYGEMLPNPGSYVDLDPDRRDKFGLPLARRHVQWGANEEKLFNDMVRWSLRILERAGAEILTVPAAPATNHELGGCRMGADARTSIVDRDCRAHDVSNLYVVDGSVFPSASEKNPTHTIMALAARAADHIAGRMRRGEL